MVSLLLDKGSNLESKTRDGLTPLHCAARSGHENVVDMMVQVWSLIQFFSVSLNCSLFVVPEATYEVRLREGPRRAQCLLKKNPQGSRPKID